jgi:hypothetical protein
MDGWMHGWFLGEGWGLLIMLILGLCGLLVLVLVLVVTVCECEQTELYPQWTFFSCFVLLGFSFLISSCMTQSQT